jgi:hypothetical protein
MQRISHHQQPERLGFREWSMTKNPIFSSLRWCAIWLVLYGSSYARIVHAADGDLDLTFGSPSGTPGLQTGFISIDFGNGSDGHQDGAHRLLRQPDGKFVAVGSVDNGFGHQAIGVTRILNNGQLDTAFGDIATPGRSIITGASTIDYTGNGIALLLNGQLVVAGTIGYGAPRGSLIAVPANGGTLVWNNQDADGSAYNDVLMIPDGRLLAAGAAAGILFAASSDFSLVLYDASGIFIDRLTTFFDLGGTRNDEVQRIAFVGSVDAPSQRLGYIYAIGSVALPDYASGHHNIECGIIKAGLYATAPRLRLEPSFGTASSGKLVLDLNTAWSAGQSGAIDGNAYCRGISVGKDGRLLVSGERYYFGWNNDHATADDSVGFVAKLDSNGVADATFHNFSYGAGFAFYWQHISTGSGLYEGMWFSLIQTNGLPLFGGLTAVDCPQFSPLRNRSWVLRADTSGAQDAMYSAYSCNTPRPPADTGFDVALDGVFDSGRVVTVGIVYSSLKPATATDFIFMRHQSDLIFSDNFDPGY